VDIPEEVSERAGVLLVRLSRGAAMQVRPHPEAGSVLIRTVPIAKATLLGGDSPWQVASDSQVREWIQSGSAIWQWLLAKGIQGHATAKLPAERIAPLASRSRP
jgi:hypothetical protein